MVINFIKNGITHGRKDKCNEKEEWSEIVANIRIEKKSVTKYNSIE